MIEYKYKMDEDIVYVKRQGEITLNDLKNYVYNIYNDFKSHKRIFILTEIIDTELRFKLTDYPMLITEISKHLHYIEKFRDAFVTTKPLSTAYSVAFERKSKSISNYSFKTFSEFNYAKAWLKKEQL